MLFCCVLLGETQSRTPFENYNLSNPTPRHAAQPKAPMATMNTLVDDFSAMLGEADALLKQAGSGTQEQAVALQAEIEAKLLAAKLQFQQLEGRAAESAKAIQVATNNYVHENPWQSIGIAAAIGFLAGVLIARR